MQQDLTSVSSADLVEMLMKDAAYYIDLCKTDTDVSKKKLVETHIELLTAELKSRDGYQEVFQDEDAGVKTGE
ncbi:MAG TPA: hypothetical protein VK489_06135 [Ferruginibacter sp.]|nr:hypothetical protein [Ferruginibacter sp.]